MGIVVPINAPMRDKTAVVTGATSGVGLATAVECARRGARVILVGRDPLRGQDAHAVVARAALGREPILLLADFQSQQEIRRLARQVKEVTPAVDVLVNNAGAIFAKRELTADGIERTFAVNHLAPFLLTNLLLDLVLAAPQGRVVTVSSETHAGRLDFDNLQGERSYGFLRAYTATKTANIVFAFELSRRLAGKKATSNAVSPGPTRTRFGDDLTGLPRLFPVVMKSIPFLFQAPEIGAQTVVQLASVPGYATVSGLFFQSGRVRAPKPVTRDRGVAQRLWNESAILTRLAEAA
jgi:retinol dehydrogenase 14